jgi:hypothetical protein
MKWSPVGKPNRRRIVVPSRPRYEKLWEETREPHETSMVLDKQNEVHSVVGGRSKNLCLCNAFSTLKHGRGRVGIDSPFFWIFDNPRDFFLISSANLFFVQIIALSTQFHWCILHRQVYPRARILRRWLSKKCSVFKLLGAHWRTSL